MSIFLVPNASLSPTFKSYYTYSDSTFIFGVCVSRIQTISDLTFQSIRVLLHYVFHLTSFTSNLFTCSFSPRWSRPLQWYSVTQRLLFMHGLVSQNFRRLSPPRIHSSPFIYLFLRLFPCCSARGLGLSTFTAKRCLSSLA